MDKLLKLMPAAIGAAGGFIVHWLGGLDKLLTALLALIVLDFITGIAKAVHNRELSSDKCFKGISHKILALSMVAVAFVIEGLIAGSFPLREIVVMFFIANEGISVTENAAAAGIPLPEQLVSVLAQLKGKKSEGETDE